MLQWIKFVLFVDSLVFSRWMALIFFAWPLLYLLWVNLVLVEVLFFVLMNVAPIVVHVAGWCIHITFSVSVSTQHGQRICKHIAIPLMKLPAYRQFFQLLHWFSLSALLLLFVLGRAGKLPFKGNKLLDSLGHRSKQKERWGRCDPTPSGVWVHPPQRDAPDRYQLSLLYNAVLCYFHWNLWGSFF